ncbi:MAG: lysoplasmalogenase [bacterium]|nr:lysoplasmalogenase [bacterium]
MFKEFFKKVPMAGRILYLISILSSFLFIFLLPGYHPYIFSYLLKIIPILSLFILVILYLDGKRRILIMLALAFCMTGDILLDLDRNANFKPALAAFLLGHIFYIIVFQLERRFEIKKILYILPIFIYAITVAFFLRNISSELMIPVMAYLAVISIMAMSAFLMRNLSLLLCVGSLVFMLSDTIIAINKFLYTIPYSTVFNIGLYFTAQIMIITGFMIREYRDL